MKSFLIKSKKNTLTLFLLFFSFVSVVYFCFVTSEYLFHSDTAYLQIWAQEALSSGSLLSKDFLYAEPRQIFNYHYLAIPWLIFFPASHFNHAFVQSIFCLIFTLSFVFFCRKIKVSFLATVLGTSFVLSFSAQVWLDMFWGQMAYGFEALVSLLVFTFSYSLVSLNKNNQYDNFPHKSCCKKYFVFSFFLFVFCVLFSMNGYRIYVWHILPIVSGILFVFMIELYIYSNFNKNYLIALGIIFSGMAFGYAIFKIITSSYVFPHNLGSLLKINPIDKIGNNILDLPYYFLSLFDRFNIPWLSKVYYGRLLVVFMLLVPVILTFLSFKRRGGGLRMLVVSYWAAFFAVVSYLCFFSDVSAAPTRYAIPFLFLSFMLVPYLIDILIISFSKRVRVLFVLVFMLFWGVNIYNMNYISSASLPDSSRYNNEELLLLRSSGVKYAYATFWNASKISVLTSEEIVVRPVLIGDSEKLAPFPVHSAYRWYNPSNDVGKTALLLTKPEYNEYEKHINKTLSRSIKILESPHFYLFVFPYNLAQDMFPTKNIYCGDGVPTTIKDINDVGICSREVRGGVHSQGFINYGPYLHIFPDSKRWKAIIRYSSPAIESQKIGWSDISYWSSTKKSVEKLAYTDLYGTNGAIKTISLPFHPQGFVTDTYEARNYWDGVADMTLYDIKIEQDD